MGYFVETVALICEAVQSLIALFRYEMEDVNFVLIVLLSCKYFRISFASDASYKHL